MHLSPILVLVTIALVATNFHSESNDSIIKIEPRVIHGSLAQENYPFYVAIVFKLPGVITFYAFLTNLHKYCKKSLIDDQNVLTAAHCIEGIASGLKNGSEFKVYLAPKQISTFNGKKIAINKFTTLIPHPNYNDDTLYADIGIVRFAKAENLGSSRICIGKTEIINQNVTLAGFGTYNCNERSDFFRCATGHTINCTLPEEAPKNTVCAELRNDQNQFAIQGKGDSGSPLFYKFQKKASKKKVFYAQVGIVSYSHKKKVKRTYCPDTRYTDVYTIPENYMTFLMGYSRAKQCEY